MKRILAMALASAAGLAFMTTPVNAASKPNMVIGQRKTLQKGQRYHFYINAAGRVRINGNAKFTMTNSSRNKIANYGSSKNQVFYLRKGNYYLTPTNTASVNSNFTNLTKIRKDFETVVETKKNVNDVNHPMEIKSGDHIKGMLGFYNYDETDAYTFKLDEPSKVTFDVNALPIYPGHYQYYSLRWKLNSNGYPLNIFTKEKSQKIVYNLPQGTYTVRLSNLRGRYNFDFKIEDGSDTVPSASKIESVTDEKDAVRVNVAQADNAKKYELMFTQKATNGNATIGIPFQNERLVGQALGTSTTIVTDPVFHNPSYGMTFKPVDGQTYLVRVRGINSDTYRGPIDADKTPVGEWSDPYEFTYHAPKN